MEKLYKLFKYKRLIIISCTLIMAGLSLNYRLGPGNNGAGSVSSSPFGSGGCNNSSCHSGGNFSPSLTIQLLSGSTPITTYASNTNYTLRISFSASNTNSSTRYGFQAVSVQAASPYTAVNAWGTLPSGTQTYTTGGRVHVEHSGPLTSNVIDIPWTSPSTTTGSITFYVGGNVVNGNNAVSGDSPVSNSLTINAPCVPPTLSGTPTHVKCKGGSDGAITLTATGASSFKWTGPGSYSSTNQNISGLKAGSYKVVATASGTCKDSITVVVTEPSTGMVVTASSNSPVCEGDTIKFTSSATGGVAPVTYSWAGPNSYSSNMQNTDITPVTMLMAGGYVVTATDANNCKATATENVAVNPKASVDTFNYMQGTGADSNKITFTTVNVTNQTSMKWLFGDGDTLVGSMNTAHTYSSSGSYTVSFIVTNACGSDTVTRTINVDPLGIGELNAADMASVYPNPANNTLFVMNKTTTAFKSVALTDITGKLLVQIPVVQQLQMIDVSKLSPGMYLLNIIAADGSVATQKININR